ncbi:MAG: IPT/TIG domain-containing protein, partial [Actinomycetota bacterium]
AGAALAASALAAWVLGSAPAGSAPTPVTVRLVDADTQQPVAPGTRVKYVANVDNSLDPAASPGDPLTLNGPGLGEVATYSPVADAGNGAVGANGAVGLSLEPGKYLVSLDVPDYKLGGAYITVAAGGANTFTTQLTPYRLDPGSGAKGLKLARLVVRAFEDTKPVNQAEDVPREAGLAGFHVTIADAVGEVTVDYFGDPLCGGQCLTGPDGEVTITNLPPGKYEVKAIPPDGSGWIQTTTIEGTLGIDAWLLEDDDGTGQGIGEGVGIPAVLHGFVKAKSFPAPAPGETRGTITGQVKTLVEFIGSTNPFQPTTPVKNPYVALVDIGRNDEQVYTGQGDAGGNFTIPNVPPGTYQLAYWDPPLDHFMEFITVNVGPTAANPGNSLTQNLGVIGTPGWFGRISGTVFKDLDGNGRRDAGEPPMAGEPVGLRFGDGTVYTGSTSDAQGRYDMPEIFPFARWLVQEIGFARNKSTGAAAHDVYWANGLQGQLLTPRPEIEAVFPEDTLTLNTLTWFGARSVVDWGKRAYRPGENGGISGIVFHATTRNELDPRLQANEDYEPGLPGVTLRLYGWNAATRTRSAYPIAEATTDHWTRPPAAGEAPCDMTDELGRPLGDPLGIGARCAEVGSLMNEVKEGVFDGGYAFTELTNDPATGAALAAPVSPIPPGDYVVEVVRPAHYQVVREQDINTDQGDAFIPQIPPAECVGAPNAVSDPRSPYDGQTRPLCDQRLVTLQDGQNAAADFHLFVDTGVTTPGEQGINPPGRIWGMVLDDVTIETNPNRRMYGDKVGIPNVPVGIRDFSGRLVTTVNTDAHGFFDVLVPSTRTINCPTPAGVCPAVYRVVTNDPGDPGAPNANYNLRYQTRPFKYEVWPGKTTVADIAPLPAANNPTDNSCGIPQGTPEVYVLTGDPYVRTSATAALRTKTVRGRGFGTRGTASRVLVGGTAVTILSWADDSITFRVPPGHPAGPGQLVVRAQNGRTSRAALTLHVIGGGYTPPVRHVDPGQSVQAAIDAAPPRALIVVRAGVHFESVILNKAVWLQGVGAGTGPAIPGSTIDGRFFDNVRAAWLARLAGTPYASNANDTDVMPGAAITIVARENDFRLPGPGQFITAPAIDGFAITGNHWGEYAGGIHVYAFGTGTRITNNRFEGNFGVTGGAVTLGQALAGNSFNDDVTIERNRILRNGGLRLAGAVGIFAGADRYRVIDNDVCGNYSGEYGGGISHYGTSRAGRIARNVIAFNEAFDESGGIMVAGEIPAPPAVIGTPSGGVTIDANWIQGNLSHDDGAGIRLLRPLTSRIRITNNMVVSNIATDIGGGIALDDAANVEIVNNTIADNASTSTAIDADGQPHSAGLVTYYHSTPFLAALRADDPGAANFSDPSLFNNVFWQNKAWTFDRATNGATFQRVIDLEVIGVPPAGEPVGRLRPRRSILTVDYPAAGATHPTNRVGTDPLFGQRYEMPFTAGWFVLDANVPGRVLITPTYPAGITGDYHVAAGSPAVALGVAALAGVAAPTHDYDGDARPQPPGWDAG